VTPFIRRYIAAKIGLSVLMTTTAAFAYGTGNPADHYIPENGIMFGVPGSPGCIRYITADSGQASVDANGNIVLAGVTKAVSINFGAPNTPGQNSYTVSLGGQGTGMGLYIGTMLAINQQRNIDAMALVPQGGTFIPFLLKDTAQAQDSNAPWDVVDCGPSTLTTAAPGSQGNGQLDIGRTGN
jgi:hypothetical protein